MTIDTSTTADDPTADDASTDTGLGHPVAQTADPIDRVVRLAPKWTVFVLIACALLVVAALVWAFNGQITQSVNAKGVLKDNGYEAITVPQDGMVTSVLVQPGDEVTEGQPLLEVTPGGTITSPRDATVSTIYVAPDSKIRAGDPALAITDLTVPDVVFTLLPAQLVSSVVADLPVEMDVSGAPASTYGYLKGRVLEVSSTPLTTEQVAQTLNLQPEVVEGALGSEPGLLAVIGLDPNPDNPSAYDWTVGEGPPFHLVQGTSMTVKVIENREKPISMLFPSLVSDSSDST